MKLGGETVTLPSNFGVGGGYGSYANMLAGVMAAPQRSLIPQFPVPVQPPNIFSSPSLSIGLMKGDEVQHDGANTEVELGKAKEDETESKSSSENIEGGSGEEHEHEDANPRPTKKRYHRHTLHQISEMERYAKHLSLCRTFTWISLLSILNIMRGLLVKS